MTPQAYRDFSSWADEHAVKGLTSEGKEAQYVPHSVLWRHWTSGNMRRTIQSLNTVISAEDVSNYICIFSTLVYMEAKGVPALHYLGRIMSRHYNDASLPWTEKLNGREDVFGSTGDRKKFIDTQWMFFPIAARPFLTTHSTMLSRVFMPNGKAESMHNRLVDAKQVFPITEILDRPADVGRAARRVTLSHMKVHSASGTQQSSPPPNIIIFKHYPPGEEKVYQDEYDGYTAIRDANKHKNILQCIGSFYYVTESGEQFSTIMLELADSGTLRDLFSGNKVPYREEHVRSIWTNFSGVLDGLATIHNRNSLHGYFCYHQDLKPSNFFLFGSKDEEKPFEYTIKIGDFGSSHSQSSNPEIPVEISPDKGATRTYGPPETFYSDSRDYKVESSADMWAIGCIMIEMAVWTIGGKLALDDFRRDRMKETEGLKHKSLGRSDCFHDGNHVLNSVKAVKSMINKYGRPHDHIALDMVDLALNSVLVDKRARLHADQLSSIFDKVLRGTSASKQSIKENLAQQSSGSTNAPPNDNFIPIVQPEPRAPSINPWSTDLAVMVQSPVSEDLASPPVASPFSATELPDNSWPGSPRVAHLNNTEESPSIRPQVLQEMSETPVTSSSFPFVSIRDLEAWANGKSQELLGQNEAKSVLHGRDFIFLIDNSRHTKQYEEEIRLWTTSLAKLIKTIDTDGIDAANTSSPQAGKIIKSKKDMTKFMDQTFERDSVVDCMIENALDTILEPLKARWTQREAAPVTPRRSRYSLYGRSQPTQPWRGVTILICTNGVWNATREGTCNAELPIRSLIDSMRKNGVPRTHVAIQFVRFGSEERGRRRLEFLDDELDQAFDIVDTKPTTASIWDVVIGPLEAGMDNNVTTSSGPSTPNHNLRLTT